MFIHRHCGRRARARCACDAAVHDALGAERTLLSWSPQTRRKSAAAAAVAYSHRAGLHWMEAEQGAAQQNLAPALAPALAPEAQFVVRNVSAMQTRQTVRDTIPAAATWAAAQ